MSANNSKYTTFLNFIYNFKRYLLEFAYWHPFLISFLIRIRFITINNRRRDKVKKTIERLQKNIQNLDNLQPLPFEIIFYLYILSMLAFIFSDENLKEQIKFLFECVYNSYYNNLSPNSDILELLKHIKVLWFGKYFSSIKSLFKIRKILSKLKRIGNPPEIIMFYDNEKYKKYLKDKDLDINPLIYLLILIIIVIFVVYLCIF